ncbi:unnamed protein product [Psylliodes chrysocephalus]|uniref:Fatty acyl-CoA reductase n=1 Tax=Psylliodes chrysocephalus TaxID=3402493 RepID=A0A9P0CXB8_9CUCU|nr:unnamed protein product [Psylliodes chrysocephala]
MEKTETPIQKFYKNANVFITGGTGFLGKILIEKLLRSTEVNTLYILIRKKRDEDIKSRCEKIFDNEITIMAKITDKLIEKRRRQKRESEQRRRETIRNNPELYEQAKQKERERYYKRKVEGKIKSVNQLNNREKRHVRKQWIKNSKKYRDNLKAVDRERIPTSCRLFGKLQLQIL